MHSVYEVFTPTSPARLNFVDRPEVNDIVVDSLRTPGKQVVVYGESGSGKSSLLSRKLEELYPDHLTTRCSAASTYDSILLDAFDQLDSYYTDSKSARSGRSGNFGLTGQFAIIKANLAATMTREDSLTTKRLLPPQLTPQRLGEFIGAKHLCWVVEDFHKVPPSEKLGLAQTFKIFSDLSPGYPDLRIIAIGATETAREVVQYDPEMRNRVAEILMPLMTTQEVSQILANGSRLLNVNLDRIESDIVQFSSGLASVAHHLALNSCLAAGVEVEQRRTIVLDSTHLNRAISRYINETSDSLKALMDVALARQRERKYDNMRLLIGALASGPVEGMSHAAIRTQIQISEPSYPASNVTQYLAKLMKQERGEIVYRSPSGNYRFRDPIIHSYARALLDVRPESNTWSRSLDEMVNKEFETLLGEFSRNTFIHLSAHGVYPSTRSALQLTDGSRGGDATRKASHDKDVDAAMRRVRRRKTRRERRKES